MNMPNTDASFVLIKKDGSRRVFLLGAGVTVIGRRSDCDLRIPLMDVSRRHCQLDRHSGLFALRDLGSSNGTFVNGEKIEEAQLKPGDHIQIGPLTFVLEVGAAALPTGAQEAGIPQSAKGEPGKAVRPMSDEEFFADLGQIEDPKGGSSTEFPAGS
jgi:pSer/pThr/pTyr-binding forkhead associated (FHA) protein